MQQGPQTEEKCQVLRRRGEGKGKFRKTPGPKQCCVSPGPLPNGQLGFSWSGARGGDLDQPLRTERPWDSDGLHVAWLPVSPVLGLEEGTWSGWGPVAPLAAPGGPALRGGLCSGAAQGWSRVRVRVVEMVPPLAVQRNWMRSWQPPRSLH